MKLKAQDISRHFNIISTIYFPCAGPRFGRYFSCRGSNSHPPALASFPSPSLGSWQSHSPAGPQGSHWHPARNGRGAASGQVYATPVPPWASAASYLAQKPLRIASLCQGALAQMRRHRGWPPVQQHVPQRANTSPNSVRRQQRGLAHIGPPHKGHLRHFPGAPINHERRGTPSSCTASGPPAPDAIGCLW